MGQRTHIEPLPLHAPGRLKNNNSQSRRSPNGGSWPIAVVVCSKASASPRGRQRKCPVPGRQAVRLHEDSSPDQTPCLPRHKQQVSRLRMISSFRVVPTSTVPCLLSTGCASVRRSREPWSASRVGQRRRIRSAGSRLLDAAPQEGYRSRRAPDKIIRPEREPRWEPCWPR